MSEMFIYLKTILYRYFLALYNEYTIKIISTLIECLKPQRFSPNIYVCRLKCLYI